MQCYAWHAPGGTLPERKVMAEGRREELLTLLYQEEISSGACGGGRRLGNEATFSHM